MQQEMQGGEGKNKRKCWRYASCREREVMYNRGCGEAETQTEAGGTGQPWPPAAAGAVTGTSRFQQQGSLILQQRSRHMLPVSTSLMAAGHTNQREHNNLLTRHRLKGSERSKLHMLPHPASFRKGQFLHLWEQAIYTFSPLLPGVKKQVPALYLPPLEQR